MIVSRTLRRIVNGFLRCGGGGGTAEPDMSVSASCSTNNEDVRESFNLILMVVEGVVKVL